MIRRLLALLAPIALAAAASGCKPRFEALTTPPPFTHAELCDATPDCGDSRRIKLTRGIALAFECTAPESSTPCTGVRAVMSDPTVATVLPGYHDSLSPGDYTSAQPRSVFVVVGTAVGQTTLSIASDQGDADFEVDIVPL